MDAALMDHGSSGVGGSFSETPLVGGISGGPSSPSSSLASSSPPRDQPSAASSPTGSGGSCGNGNGNGNDGNGNAGLATAGPTTTLSGSPRRSRPHVCPATAAPISTEDVSKLDLAIMACSTGLVVPVALNIRDLTSSWDTRWKVLYGVLMIWSIVSTVTGFFTAWCPAVSWGRRLSPTTCARFGLIDAAALFIVFLACKLGRFGCAAGVPSAALVVLVLAVVWACSESEQPPAASSRGGADDAVVDVEQQLAQLRPVLSAGAK